MNATEIDRIPSSSLSNILYVPVQDAAVPPTTSAVALPAINIVGCCRISPASKVTVTLSSTLHILASLSLFDAMVNIVASGGDWSYVTTDASLVASTCSPELPFVASKSIVKGIIVPSPPSSSVSSASGSPKS